MTTPTSQKITAITRGSFSFDDTAHEVLGSLWHTMTLQNGDGSVKAQAVVNHEAGERHATVMAMNLSHVTSVKSAMMPDLQDRDTLLFYFTTANDNDPTSVITLAIKGDDVLNKLHDALHTMMGDRK